KHGNLNNIHREMKNLPKDNSHLPLFEQNLFKHVMGIYHMATEDHPKSIQLLKGIDFDHYSNALVYLDLATAYHYNNSPVLAYYYAEKALRLYKQKNNFPGIIDTENLMIIQIEIDQHRDFTKKVKQYKNLIHLCDLCHSPDKKAKILHNFAYEHLKRKNYHELSKIYKQSMKLKDKYTAIYLLSLEGFIRAGSEGSLLSREELLKIIHEGLEIAKEINEELYTKVLTLHKHAILKRKKQ